MVTDEMVEAVSKLVTLHQRLLGCFTAPTGVALPRRPRSLEPTMADCSAALTAMVTLERAKAEIERLSKVVCSDMLNGLLTEDESAALIGFVKELRQGSAETPAPLSHTGSDRG